MASNNSVLNIVIRARDLAKGALQKITKSIRRVGNASDDTSEDLQQMGNASKRTSADMKKMGKAGNQLNKSFASLGNRIRNLVAASLGFYALKKSMQGVLETGGQFERLEVQLNAIMGSMAEGEQAMAWIKEFTKNTPLELQQVADAFTALKNFGLDPMDGTLQAIVDQTSKLGGGMERLNGISLALGQAWAKQKLQGEEILQLVERGVPVWSLLEKVTGKNTQELQKLSSAGKLGRETIKGLIDEIGKSSAGAAKANMGLLSGLMSNMADRWTEFKDSIADAGWLDYVKKQLAAFSKKLDELEKNGKLQELAQKISDGFISMAESVRLSLSSISFEQVIQKTTEAFNTVSTTLGQLRSAFEFTGNFIKVVFNTFTISVKGFAAGILSVLAEISYGWQKLFEVAGLDTLEEKFTSATNLMRDQAAAFKKEMIVDANDIKDAMAGMYKSFETSSKNANANIRNHSKITRKMIQEEQNRYKEALDETNDKLKETGDIAKQAFKDAADAMAQISSAETRTELASLGVALAEAFSLGQLNLEEYTEATEASRQKLKELKEQADTTKKALTEVGGTSEESGEQQTAALQDATSIAGVMAGHYNAITAELKGMSSAAHDAFVAIQKGGGSVDTSAARGSIEELKNELKATSAEISSLQRSQYQFDVTGIHSWLNETASNAAHVKKQFLEQKIALEDLMASYENGELSARRFAREGEHAASTLNLLNEQDLSRLDSAIQQAEDSMESLNDSARSTLEGLQNELDRLQGKQDEIEKRQYKSRQRDLKSQLEEAKAGGDQQSIQDLNKALQVNEAIYQERRKQLAEEQRTEQRQKLTSQRENSRINPPPQSAHSKQAEKIIRLEYPGGSVNVGINQSDESKLLEALKNAGLRSV
ncbi:tape measure protein [Endozoicomonas acroporae]|uniref:tape measure protein n=1 Tax=Endozoicomonas acroporae TaxID=1701104 RepID=UPI003D7B920B